MTVTKLHRRRRLSSSADSSTITTGSDLATEAPSLVLSLSSHRKQSHRAPPISAGHARHRQPRQRYALSNNRNAISPVVLVPDDHDNAGNVTRNNSNITKKRKQNHHHPVKTELTQSFTISPSRNSSSSSVSLLSHPVSPPNNLPSASAQHASFFPSSLYGFPPPPPVVACPQGELPWMPSPPRLEAYPCAYPYSMYFPPMHHPQQPAAPDHPRIISSILKKRNLRYSKSKNEHHYHYSSSSSWCCPFPSLSSSKNSASASSHGNNNGGTCSASSVFRLEPSSISRQQRLSPGTLIRSKRFDIPLLEKATRITKGQEKGDNEQQQQQVPCTNNSHASATTSMADSHTVTPHPNDEYKMWRGYGGIPHSPYHQHQQYWKEVRFYPNVYKKIIPSRKSYSPDEKQTLWSTPEEIQRTSQRNILEFTYDHWNWRKATEESKMYYNSRTGRRDIHPAIAKALYHKQQQKKLLQLKQQQQAVASAEEEATSHHPKRQEQQHHDENTNNNNHV